MDELCGSLLHQFNHRSAQRIADQKVTLGVAEPVVAVAILADFWRVGPPNQGSAA